ncbi:MAG: hypothetical protein ACQETE_03585 [Bacteroidota bacterium]
MNIQGIGLNNSTAPARSSQSVQTTAQLSKDEQKMISDQFPKGSNKKLELYMSSGNQRTENPDARGNNFDYRV